mgnify:CR=1 FL=1
MIFRLIKKKDKINSYYVYNKKFYEYEDYYHIQKKMWYGGWKTIKSYKSYEEANNMANHIIALFGIDSIQFKTF